MSRQLKERGPGPARRLERAIAAVREHVRDLNFGRLHRRRLKKQPQSTRHGFLFNGPRIFLDPTWEYQEQELIARLLTTTDLFVNVGANVGYYCLLAQRQSVRTIAFEPDSMNCELLIRNMSNNGYNDNIVLLPVAAGDVSGFAEIHGRMSTVTLLKVYSDTSIPKRVPVVRLDDCVLGNNWTAGRIVVLIDVEGWESYVLKGANGMLALDPKPIWIIEVLSSDNDVDGSPDKGSEVFSVMREAGYRSYHIAPDGNLPEVLDERRRLNGAWPAFGHNYLFVDSSIEVLDMI